MERYFLSRRKKLKNIWSLICLVYNDDYGQDPCTLNPIHAIKTPRGEGLNLSLIKDTGNLQQIL